MPAPAVGSILSTQAVEVLVGHHTSVGRLPGPHVDGADRVGILNRCRPDREWHRVQRASRTAAWLLRFRAGGSGHRMSPRRLSLSDHGNIDTAHARSARCSRRRASTVRHHGRRTQAAHPVVRRGLGHPRGGRGRHAVNARPSRQGVASEEALPQHTTSSIDTGTDQLPASGDRGRAVRSRFTSGLSVR